MSEKVKGKKGFITTNEILVTKGTWKLEIDFVSKGNISNHGEGFGIWLTHESPIINHYEPDMTNKDVPNAYGLFGSHTGFGVITKMNSTADHPDLNGIDENFYASNLLESKDQVINTDNFMIGAKICNRKIFQSKIHKIILEYSQNQLSVIIAEEDGLHTCDKRWIEDFSKFY